MGDLRSCASCDARVERTAGFCPRCGGAMRRPGRALRAVVSGLLLTAAAVAIAWPAVEGWRARASCEPVGWVDWHLAMQRACLTPEYVCANMTSRKLLEDPEIAGEVRRALESGDSAALGALDGLIGEMRAQYGCDGPASAHGQAAEPVLPPGHPPIGPGDRAPTFDGPSGLDI